jgi:putative ABC transport system permease protein
VAAQGSLLHGSSLAHGYARATLGLVIPQLIRRPARTLLTALGTAVGVATIVALLGVTAGIKESAGGLAHLGQGALGVFQRDAADPTTSVLPVGLAARLEAQPGIDQAVPIQLVVEKVKGQPQAVVFGSPGDGFVVQRLVLTKGHAPQGPREVAVGDGLAGHAKVGLGDRLQIGKRRFTVVGVYHAGVLFEDQGAFVTLGAAQRLAGRRREATTMAVTLTPTAKPKQVAKQLRRAFPGLTIITEPEEAARAGANGVLISKAVLVIVVMALVIGGIAVANTMLMAVLERRGEFALLSAVGWSGPQVAGLVLAEGIGVSLLGAAIGLLFGVIGADLLVHALGAQAFVSPEVTAWGLGRGLLVGLAIGVLGGLYPAWRVTRLPAASALARR